ncbi:hypothetical protein [Vibrio pelagius]|uniref:hypothetical protein n=1 Tax=Vibrio pelagius TaxID=28169 RepID=UPI0021C48E98|nr:hypothetical protein [Vibrio pelagius]
MATSLLFFGFSGGMKTALRHHGTLTICPNLLIHNTLTSVDLKQGVSVSETVKAVQPPHIALIYDRKEPDLATRQMTKSS